MHSLILTSIAIAVIALVLAYGWVGMVERRLTALETRTKSGPESDT